MGEPVIDPNLREEFFHKTPQAGTKHGQPKGKGAAKLKPVANGNGGFVLVPSDGDDASRQLQSEEASATHAAAKKEKRGRGRPRKTAEEKASEDVTKPKKRKKKHKSAERVEDGEDDAVESEAPPKKRAKTTDGLNLSLEEQMIVEPTTVDANEETNAETNGEADVEMDAGADDEANNELNGAADADANTDANAEARGEPEQWPEAGPLVKKEQAILDGVMKQYREGRGIDQREVNAMIQNTNRAQSEQTKELWSLLYEALPQRPHVSIMRATRRRYHNFEIRGKWSAEDDENLKRAHEASPGKWVKIGSLLGRMPEDCRDRWRNYLRCGDDRKTDDWNDKEEEQLTNAVTECMNAARQEAKDRAKEQGHAFREQDWETFVNFNNVSEKMGYTRSRLQCYTHWKIMQKRANTDGQKPTPVRKNPEEKGPARTGRALAKYEKMTAADKFNILQQVAESGATTEDEINWKAIRRRDSGNKWTTRDRKETFQKIKQLVPPQESLRETIETVSAHLLAKYPQEFNMVGAPPSAAGGGEDEFDNEGVRAMLRREIDATGGDDRSGERTRLGDVSGIGTAGPSVEDMTDPDLHLARALQGIAQLSQAREEALRQTAATDSPTTASRKKKRSKKT